MLLSSSLFSASVSGFVYEKDSGEKVPYVSIMLENTNRGIYTNEDGYFVLNNISNGKHVLIVNHISYKPQRIDFEVKNQNESIFLKIELEQTSIKMDGIEVKGEKFEDFKINTREIVLSDVNLKGRVIQEIPEVGESDVLRAIQTLPGVGFVSDYSSGLYVRGGSPDQNQILLDDTDVYNPEDYDFDQDFLL